MCGTRVDRSEAVILTVLCWLTALSLLEYGRESRKCSAERRAALACVAFPSQEAAPSAGVFQGGCFIFPPFKSANIYHLSALIVVDGGGFFFNYTLAKSGVLLGS